MLNNNLNSIIKLLQQKPIFHITFIIISKKNVININKRNEQ